MIVCGRKRRVVRVPEPAAARPQRARDEPCVGAADHLLDAPSRHCPCVDACTLKVIEGFGVEQIVAGEVNARTTRRGR